MVLISSSKFTSRAITLVSIAASISNTVAGDADNLNPTGEGCVDPKGFLDCYADQQTKATECATNAPKTCSGDTLTECLAACGNSQLAGNVGCWVQSCWNQFNSCEYQGTCMQYLSGTDLVQATVDLPYYPAPDGSLPGGCSCNIGNVYGNLTYIATYDPCLDFDVVSNVQDSDNCNCCATSLMISNTLNLCPTSNLTVLGFDDSLSIISKALESASPDQCTVLESDPALCTTSYTFPYIGTTIYNPLSLPSGVPGSEPLTNSPGEALTSFVDEYTLVLFPAYTTTITPAAYNARNAASSVPAVTGGDIASVTPSVGGSGSGSASPSVTGSGTGAAGTSAAASPSTTKSGATGQMMLLRGTSVLAAATLLVFALL